jgi:hypothetical protein
MEPSAAQLVARPAPRRVSSSLAALAGAVALSLLALTGCGTEPATTSFRGAAVNAAPADPFTSSFGTDQVGVRPPAHVTGAYPATTPGLYGGGGTDAVCDPAALVAFLDAAPAKAAAWAGALGIGAADIDAYVARLTPVVLRADTVVTDHGYTDGKAVPAPSVFQAGTAVLVDDRGLPVVQCSSGNPLTAASTGDASFEGADWDGFRAEAVTTVVPAPAPVTSFVIADPSGNGVVRPIGTTGAADAPYDPPADESAPVTPAPALSDPDAGYPGSVAPDSDYPLGSPTVTTTYLATYQPSAAGTGGCRRSGLLDDPFTITVRVRDGATAETGVVTIEGDGSNHGSVDLGSPLPTANVTDLVGIAGTFSAGSRRTYDTPTREGVLNAHWSGGLGDSLPRPAEFPLTVRQTWARDPGFVAWLSSSGGPEHFYCAFDVVAVRQS